MDSYSSFWDWTPKSSSTLLHMGFWSKNDGYTGRFIPQFSPFIKYWTSFAAYVDQSIISFVWPVKLLKTSGSREKLINLIHEICSRKTLLTPPPENLRVYSSNKKNPNLPNKNFCPSAINTFSPKKAMHSWLDKVPILSKPTFKASKNIVEILGKIRREILNG